MMMMMRIALIVMMIVMVIVVMMVVTAIRPAHMAMAMMLVLIGFGLKPAPHIRRFRLRVIKPAFKSAA